MFGYVRSIRKSKISNFGKGSEKTYYVEWRVYIWQKRREKKKPEWTWNTIFYTYLKRLEEMGVDRNI